MSSPEGPGRVPSPAERERLGLGSPPAGLCASCRHLRLLSSKTSTFVRCALAEADPRFRRYPPLPVLRCDGWLQADALPAQAV